MVIIIRTLWHALYHVAYKLYLIYLYRSEWNEEIRSKWNYISRSKYEEALAIYSRCLFLSLVFVDEIKYWYALIVFHYSPFKYIHINMNVGYKLFLFKLWY